MANAKASIPSSKKIFSRSYIDAQAKKCDENIAKYQLGKPNRNPYVVYEERKKQWDQQHPDAKPEQRDAAMTRIARECGV
ncbi:hypothetical protein [Undibacterium flavidum]|uniref:Uncharacterized protein n=1 Tax=Undibacterium flavidum TaxID=2762297 RepID=A0ABR6YCI4_9BURK|nr:hypothetical protein [Undibacterium flavidum]MBC3874259.1 hypothetical protein [Undibacterium flavidum]